MAKKAEIRFHQNKCKGCGLCIEACPKMLLKLGESLNNLGYPFVNVSNNEHCSGCGLCALMCPDIAIEICSKSV